MIARIRATLAAAALDLASAPPVPPRLGPITLRPHQQLAVARLRRALATHHGALLADAVGLGKTWTALAVVRDALAATPAAATPLVVAPAALRVMWRDAAAAAGLPLTVCSTEALSAPFAPPLPTRPPLVVVDEAHHFRTPGTRRRGRLADVCAHAPTLLLTATPVHNTARDLAALLALFLGERAHALDAATLAHLVVRRRHADLRHADLRHADVRRAPGAPGTPLGASPGAPNGESFGATAVPPRVARARWHRPPAATAVRRALLALPPPLPAADGTAAPALATLTLVRLWASSDAALRAALRRRLARAAALAHALAAGRHPDRRTLAAWAPRDDALQLPLFVDGAEVADAPALARHVAGYTAALRAALAALDAAAPADPPRVAWLRAVRDEVAGPPGARRGAIVAFTQFADTARAYFRAFAPDGHVGLLTAAGGRIASGPIPRDALLARFAPPGAATGATPPPDIERVDLLVTTDCLSEGLDLRAASAVVHLDVPWTPARLTQRVGRAARLGSPHPVVHVHGLRPDPATDRWLRLARRLRAKARAARQTLGAPGRAFGTHRRRDPPPAAHAAVHRLCERWLAASPGAAPTPARAAVRCGHAGFVAVLAPASDSSADAPVGTGRPPLLLAALDGRRVTTAPRVALRALRALARPDACAAAPPEPLVAAARRAVRAWARRHGAAASVGVVAPAVFDAADRRTARGGTTSGVRAALARADRLLRAAPPECRPARAAAVARLRAGAARLAGAGAAAALDALRNLADDDAWLAAARDVLAPGAPPAHDAPAPGALPGGRPFRLTALVLLLP